MHPRIIIKHNNSNNNNNNNNNINKHQLGQQAEAGRAAPVGGICF